MDHLKSALFDKARVWYEAQKDAERDLGARDAVTFYCQNYFNAYFSLIAETGLYDEFQKWMKERE